MERWFLKTLINVCKVNQKEARIDIESFLPYLYGNVRFEYPYGLGMLTKPGLTINTQDVIEMCPILLSDGDGPYVGGGIFRYRGFGYLLLLPPYPFPLEKEKPIVDSLFLGKFQDFMGCQYNWHNEGIIYTYKKPKISLHNPQSVKFTTVNAQSIVFTWH